jgi:hypothetical protein
MKGFTWALGRATDQTPRQPRKATATHVKSISLAHCGRGRNENGGR